MNTENEIVGFESFCEKVQYTVSVGDELTEEMKAHIETCEECRTFLEQTELVQAELAKMSFESFTKDGKSVADSVMEEIGRQKMFAGGGNTKKTSGVFRHMGLIAACAVIFVMAIPVMNTVFNTGKDSAVEYAADDGNYNNAVPENQKITAYKQSAMGDVADGAIEEAASETAYADVVEPEMKAETKVTGSSGANMMMFMSKPLSAELEDDTVVAEAELYDDSEITAEAELFDSEVDEYSFYEGFALTEADKGAEIPENDAVEPTEKEIVTTDYSKEELTSSGSKFAYRYGVYENGAEMAFEDVEEAALQGALMYCDGDEVIVEASLVITYTDSDTAYAVYTIENNGEITVYLKNENGMWVVIDVCDGDITE